MVSFYALRLFLAPLFFARSPLYDRRFSTCRISTYILSINVEAKIDFADISDENSRDRNLRRDSIFSFSICNSCRRANENENRI